MISKRTEKLIINFFTNQSSISELDELTIWVKELSNEEIFIKYAKINYAINFNMKQFDSNNSKKELLKLIKKEKKVYKIRKVKNTLKYAATIVVLFGTGYILQSIYFNNTPSHIIKSEDITLQLENGNIKIINESDATKIVDPKGNILGVQDSTQLVYNNSKKETLVYNVLNVPYGKRFKLQLSDGTKIHLNAGTTLKYPVNFIKGEERKVFLKGEAFFNVAKDTKHPFIVNSGELDIKVLGTQFNVSSYSEDSATDVVLVEGSVNLFSEIKNKLNNSVLLKPGFKASYNRIEANISTKPVITDIYTSWVHGELFFRNITFGDILKKMERHYNVTIINKNSSLAKEEFNASFKEAPIEKILEYFKIAYNIDYIINDSNIIIE